MRASHPFAPAVAAMVFLTRIPMRLDGAWPEDLSARAMGCFPIIGAMIGLAGGLMVAAGSMLGVPPLPAAALGVCVQLLLTGALHEDGLADVADAFGGGRDREARLAILKDSRIGTFGAAALCLALFLRVGLVAGAADPVWAMVVAGAVSRSVPAPLAAWLPPARRDGLAAATGRPGGIVVVLSCASAVLIALVATMSVVAALSCALAGAFAALVTGLFAKRLIGGVTGDVHGCAQQVAEVLILLVLVSDLA